jgi:hypothetical protein
MRSGPHAVIMRDICDDNVTSTKASLIFPEKGIGKFNAVFVSYVGMAKHFASYRFSRSD